MVGRCGYPPVERPDGDRPLRHRAATPTGASAAPAGDATTLRSSIARPLRTAPARPAATGTAGGSGASAGRPRPADATPMPGPMSADGATMPRRHVSAHSSIRAGLDLDLDVVESPSPEAGPLPLVSVAMALAVAFLVAVVVAVVVACSPPCRCAPRAPTTPAAPTRRRPPSPEARSDACLSAPARLNRAARGHTWGVYGPPAPPQREALIHGSNHHRRTGDRDPGARRLAAGLRSPRLTRDRTLIPRGPRPPCRWAGALAPGRTTVERAPS